MDNLTLIPLDYGDQHALQKQSLFLYDLLKERSPAANISHKEIPAFHQHLAFINSRPYAVWNIIASVTMGPGDGGYEDPKPIGSIYLTRNDEIGLFLSKDTHGQGAGKMALDLFMKQNPRPKYLANVAPTNHLSQQFFQKQGFRCIQFTYQREAECAD
jgi:RimJ/RimL family protein N-acetyltransferase